MTAGPSWNAVFISVPPISFASKELILSSTKLELNRLKVGLSGLIYFPLLIFPVFWIPEDVNIILISSPSSPDLTAYPPKSESSVFVSKFFKSYLLTEFRSLW